MLRPPVPVQLPAHPLLQARPRRGIPGAHAEREGRKARHKVSEGEQRRLLSFLLEDGTFYMDTTTDGKFFTLKREGWMSAPAYVKAAVNSFRQSSTPSPSQGGARPVRPARSQAQNSRPVRPVPSQVQNVSPVPPAPLPPVGVGGASHTQLYAVLFALQQQTADLQRSQELQATENAQIMTSMAGTMTKQQEPASNEDGEKETRDEGGIDMGNTD